MSDYNYDGQMRYKKKRNIPYITIGLIAINVIVFIVMEFFCSTEDTEFLYNHGAMYLPDVIDNGEYYRIITHMFMHAGSDHLFSNMFMLAALGNQIENEYGRLKFLVSYFVCGIAGTVVSGLYEMRIGEYAVGVGASGAIMGIFGVLLAMIFLQRKQEGQIPLVRLAVVFAIMVFGNMQEGIDWMAHFGGAAAGVIMGALLYRTKNIYYDYE